MKIDRLISIIMILLDQERIGAQALADRFEVSPRTIYRDIDAINRAGIPVHATPGVGGGFAIMPHYKMDRKTFSSADISAILMGLSSLSSIIQGEELVNALTKMRSFIPADRAKELALQTDQIHIDLTPWFGNGNIQPYLEIIKEAMQQNKLLSFSYSSHHGHQTARTVEPYQLVLKNSQWYVHGYCTSRNDFRLFKLSRIAHLRLQEAHFTPRDHQPPQLDFSGAIGAMQTTITLRIHQSILDQILDYCTYEHLSPDGGTHYLVDFPFIENEYFYHILIGFGDRCECLAPSHVRTELLRRIHAMAALYER